MLFPICNGCLPRLVRQRTIGLLYQVVKIINRVLFPIQGRSSTFCAVAALILIQLLFANCRMNQPTDSPTATRHESDGNKSASSIHRRAIIIDMHTDTTQRLVDEQLDIAARLSDGHFDTVRAKEGGLDAQFFSIWVEPQLFGGGGARAIKRADDQIAAVRRLVDQHPESWGLAKSADDVRRIASQGKMAALMGLEGGYAIDERLENVERYYNMGVRYMSPAWSVSTSWAGSSGDQVGHTRGLNEFGKDVVREMNRLGMMIDVSHVSDKTFWDIINTSTKPIIATHSGCRAIANVPRNLDDEMIRAIAKGGGVICVLYYPAFLEPGWEEKKQAVDAEIASLVLSASEAEPGDVAHKKMARDRVRRDEYAKRLPPVGIARLVDHIDYIVKLVGVDHVGIGSDFDGVQATLSDLATVADLENLTVELVRRGYSPDDIEKILGGNVLRLMEAVQK